jgi:peptidoglycan/LPS O-acetylase OafA/YrhL
MLTQLLVTCGAIGVTLVFALVSWNAFEKHFLRLKRHFDGSPRSASAASPGAELTTNESLRA